LPLRAGTGKLQRSSLESLRRVWRIDAEARHASSTQHTYDWFRMKPAGPFRTVIFDCDSTLSTIEGIEELARDHRAEVEALTEEAMRGSLPLEQVYGRRLELVRPPRSRVLALGQRYIETLVPDAIETVAALRAEGIDVRVISGGLKPAVLAVARKLGIADQAVAAVDLYFGPDGGYAGFEEGSPLATSGGKRRVIESWQLDRPVLMVGDGATDLEARPVVDGFAAFAGVVYRAPVVAAADYVIRDNSLAPILPLALGGRRPASVAAQELFDRGIAFLGPQQ
jgi:phosphoserine phosphatase